MKHRLFLIILCLIVSTAIAESQQKSPISSNRYNNVPAGGVLSSGPLPDLNAFTADGKPLKVRELCKGKYTVLSAGCLTCPQFHLNYPQIEAAYADYEKKGVQFFYFYKYLRHPELNGYVQAQNMAERLLQLAEARKKLGTKVPWIADTLDDSMRIGLRSGSFSVFLISPEGKIIFASDKIDGDGLRAALTKAVCPIANPTKVSDLDLPRLKRQGQPLNEDSSLGVARPTGLSILSTVPAKPLETYYVKLRTEADDTLLSTGTGRLFLGFYPDPIHDAHWNNLAPPMKYSLKLPKGVSATPSEATAKKGIGDSDTLPRQFWVDIPSHTPVKDIQLTLNYYGCTPNLCMALTHEYTIRFEFENRGSSTYGLNRGPGGGKSQSSRGGQSQSNSRGGRMAQMDTDKDGSVLFKEMCDHTKKQRGDDFSEENVRRRFDAIDTNKDGMISSEEMEKAPRGQGRQGQGERGRR
ncbi:MAG: hypothetical protein K9M57_07810 [Phycisphaerae bacterium]|nr:hypothetical protein [Phycisphaerae bacterium]